MKLQWGIIILVLIMTSCNSQIGVYCTEPNYTAFCYELKKGRKFKFDEGTCTGASQGIGEYEIIGDTIKFKFKKHEINRGGYELDKIKEIDKGIIVNLMVIDSQSSEPIIGYDAAMYSEDVLIGGKSGDIEGKARVVTAFNHKPIKIEISFTGMHPLNFEIKEEGEYKVLAELVNGWSRPVPKQERIYRLIKLNKEVLVIGGLGEEDWSQTLYRYEEKKK